MIPKFYVLSTGTELTTGRSKDSNATFISRTLSESGYGIIGLGVLPDNPDILHGELKRILENPECSGIIMTGGMGPTEDDHTVDVLCRLSGREAVEDPDSLEKLQRRAKDLPDRIHVETARRQVRIVKGAHPLHNERGLAPGMILEIEREGTSPAIIAAMSGFPQEMHTILENYLLPELKQRYPQAPVRRRSFYIYGVGESSFQTNFFGTSRKSHSQLDAPVEDGAAGKLPEDFQWGISAAEGRIRVFFESADEGALERLYRLAVKQYGERLLPAPVQDLIHDYCTGKKLKIGIAESCTGGLVGKTITDRSGSSAYFMGSLVTYSNQAKMRFLNVPESMINKQGAVSEDVAEAMARGAIEAFRADYAVGITGIAGPEGGTQEKPVGTVFIGCASKSGLAFTTRIFYPLDRDRIREFTTGLALYHLYRFMTSEAD